MSRNDKMKFIRFIEGADLCISDALARYNVPRSTYYRWKRKLRNQGSRVQTNPTPGTIEIAIIRGQVVMDMAERVDPYAEILLQLVIGGKEDFYTVFSVRYRFSSKGLLKNHIFVVNAETKVEKLVIAK